MIASLRNLIKRARITQPSTDDGQFATQQVEYMKKASVAEIIFPYGVHANLPVDSIVTCFNVLGYEQDKVALGGLPQERIKNLEEGEVVFFHPITKSKIYFKNDGNIEISAEKDGENKDINVTVKNVNVTAKSGVNIIVENGDATIDCNNAITNCETAQINASSSFDVDSPSSNLGTGGPAIARVGDSVQVTVTGGSSAGTYTGQITSGGANTSI